MNSGGYTYDAGMLIACERGQRGALAFHKRAVARDKQLTVPAGVLAQVWRGGPQAALSRVLAACEVQAMDEPMARSAGATCAVASSADVVDASVVAGALLRHDVVVTSDPKDVRGLIGALGQSIEVHTV